MTSRCLIASAARALIIAAALWQPADCFAQDGGPVTFINAVRKNDDDEAKSDRRLMEYLQRHTGIQFRAAPADDYAEAIEAVANRSAQQPPYVARLTPYAFVAAELQGARFEPLAAYTRLAYRDPDQDKNKGENDDGKEAVYRAYFVVRRAPHFPERQPTLDEIAAYLKSGNRRFVYHDAFSTSSYFIPSLFFKKHHIYQLPFADTGSAPGLERPLYPVTLAALPTGSSSSLIVQSVREGHLPNKKDEPVDIGAVWDGTYDKEREAADLWFVPLEGVLPNDLLVCSVNLDEKHKSALKKAIQDMGPLCTSKKLDFEGDVACWEDYERGEHMAEARKALAGLRRLAIPAPTPVTVEVLASGNAVEYREYIEAAKHAIRFAGTEFVVHDPDFHTNEADVTWKLFLPYEGALKLTSIINGLTVNGQPAIPAQQFDISYVDVSDDLPKRIESRIHSEMNRIRYVWPFQRKSVTVLRDVNLSLPEDTALFVQKVTWTDPARHAFSSAAHLGVFRVRKGTNLRRWTLESTAAGQPLELDPMSNVAYRVVLVRPKVEMPMFRYLTIVLVVLFLGAAIAAVIETWRRARMPEEGESPSSGELVVAKAPPTGAKA